MKWPSVFSTPGAGIKAQVCSLVELLVTTLYQAYAVFYVPPEGRLAETGLGSGLLFATLENATSTTSAGTLALTLSQTKTVNKSHIDSRCPWPGYRFTFRPFCPIFLKHT